MLLLFFTLSLIFFIGLYDDKFNLSPNKRLVLLSIIICNFLYFNKSILITSLNFGFLDQKIFLKNISFVFTFFCILVFIISLNMFDGTNFQSASFYIFLTGYFLFQSIELNLFLVFLSIPLAIFTIKNSRGISFLGDSGTYLLSFLFAFFIIYNHKYLKIQSDEIVMLIIFPIVDSIRLYFSRLLKNQDPFLPDRKHYHHLIRNKFNENLSFFIITISFLTPFVIFKIFNSSLISLFFFLLLYSLIIYKLKGSKIS